MSVDNKNILFVENDPDFREPVEKLLKLEQFNVISASNIKDGLKLLDNNYDIAIFDTKFTEGNGIDLLKIYKEKYKKPAILLTIKNALEDRIEALSYGSDYYLAKPIIFDELLAVIRNLLKKYEVQSNYWILDPSNVSLTDPNNKKFKLTNTEYNIFEIIIKNSDNFISRNEIFKVLGKEEASSSDRSSDMLISRIRKKIEPVSKNQKIFTSIRGKGYKFTQLIKFYNN